MPIEAEQLRDAPIPIKRCPKCGAEPFDPFMRGQAQRAKSEWWRPWRLRPYCALICWNCKEIVGYE